MSEDGNSPGLISGRGCSTQRLADALLHSLGSDQITLRIAGPATGDTDSQLGLEAPSSADLQISPAMVKVLASNPGGKRRVEVTLSSRSLTATAKSYGIADMAVWLLRAQGLVDHGQLMSIETVVVDRFFGSDCLYHLTATE